MGFRQELRRYFLIYALLAVSVGAVYWQVVDFDFVNFDDASYVVNNPWVHMGLTKESIRWALTATYQCTWQPATWMSYMLDATVGGIDPAVFHLTNVLLHLANTFLVFFVLRSYMGFPWRAAFVALLFAVHPLHVESVAWVAERKDVLSTFFFLLALAAYLRFTRSGEPRDHLLLVVLFVLGLASKPMVVTLPLILLLLDWWPLRRFAAEVEKRGGLYAAVRELAAEKLPLFVLSAASAAVTSYVMYAVPRAAGSVAASELSLPFGVRLANALVSYVTYIVKTFWPTDLAVFYPHPGNTLPEWQVIGSAAFLAAVTVLVVRAARKRPYLLFGWIWFLVTLLPVSGLMQPGMHGMADRFTYIPHIGMFVMVVWGIADAVALPGRLRRPVLAAGACAVVVVLTVVSSVQVGYWRDSVTLFEHALRVAPPNAVSHYSLGCALHTRGDLEGALKHYRAALRFDPENPKYLNDAGAVLYEMGDYDAAERYFRKALSIRPDFPMALNNLGSVFLSKRRLDAAIDRFQAALRLDPSLASARENLDRALTLKELYE